MLCLIYTIDDYVSYPSGQTAIVQRDTLTETERVFGSAALSMTALSRFLINRYRLVKSFEKSLRCWCTQLQYSFYVVDRTIGLATTFTLSNLGNHV